MIVRLCNWLFASIWSMADRLAPPEDDRDDRVEDERK
jgi:hypothetical protein